MSKATPLNSFALTGVEKASFAYYLLPISSYSVHCFRSISIKALKTLEKSIHEALLLRYCAKNDYLGRSRAKNTIRIFYELGFLKLLSG